MSNRVDRSQRGFDYDAERLRLSGGSDAREAERLLADPKTKADTSLMDSFDGAISLVSILLDNTGTGQQSTYYYFPGQYRILYNVTINSPAADTVPYVINLFNTADINKEITLAVGESGTYKQVFWNGFLPLEGQWALRVRHHQVVEDELIYCNICYETVNRGGVA